MTRITVLCCLIALGLFARETGDGQFRTTANSVMVDVTVRDSKGKPIVGLGIDDFELELAGIRPLVDADP